MNMSQTAFAFELAQIINGIFLLRSEHRGTIYVGLARVVSLIWTRALSAGRSSFPRCSRESEARCCEGATLSAPGPGLRDRKPFPARGVKRHRSSCSSSENQRPEKGAAAGQLLPTRFPSGFASGPPRASTLFRGARVD